MHLFVVVRESVILNLRCLFSAKIYYKKPKKEKPFTLFFKLCHSALSGDFLRLCAIKRKGKLR